ncbi:Erythrocyte band 7 integral membrane protein, partial [Ophiophagus hannah]
MEAAAFLDRNRGGRITDLCPNWWLQRRRMIITQIFTKDPLIIDVDGVVYYRVRDAFLAVTKISDADAATSLLAKAIMKNTLGTQTLSHLISDREKVAKEIQVHPPDRKIQEQHGGVVLALPQEHEADSSSRQNPFYLVYREFLSSKVPANSLSSDFTTIDLYQTWKPARLISSERHTVADNIWQEVRNRSSPS